MTKKDIIDAWARIRKIDNTIPDDVLDFMKNTAIQALGKIEQTKKNVTMATKKPTQAQEKILQQMNEDICILRQYSNSQVLWIRLFNYQDSRFIGTRNENPISQKTLEILIFNEWVKIDHSKNTAAHFYYFITYKGKAIFKNE